MKRKAGYALVSAMDEAFVPGVELLMYSFLRFNPWFKGDWIVISDGLSQSAKNRLARLYPARFMKISAKLRRKALGVIEKDPITRGRFAQFFNLELFSLQGYRRVVFLDSDMLCLGDLSPLFFKAPDFGVACDDLSLDPWFPELRSPRANGLTPNRLRYGRELKQSFNSGMLSISSRFLGSRILDSILADPYFDDPGSFRESAGTTDQFVLNRRFGDLAKNVGSAYNWPLHLDPLLRHAFRATAADIRLLHFAGMAKPWKLSATEIAKRRPWEERHYYSLWHQLRQEMTEGLGHAEALADHEERTAERAKNGGWRSKLVGKWRGRWRNFLRLTRSRTARS